MSKAKVFEGIDWSTQPGDRGYHVVSIGPDPTPETVQAFRDAYDLGCAWAAAEAALPDGWGIALSSDGDSPNRYRAHAGRIEFRWPPTIVGPVFAATPAAALLALADKLGEG